MEREKIKLLVIGCPKSGKSALIHRYNVDEFVPGLVPSHGDLVAKIVTFNNNDISLHIWELEDTQSNNPSFYEGTDGLILVSDVTSIESVVGLNELYNRAKLHLGIVDNTFPVAVVANKIDLKDSDTLVTLSGLRRWATSIWPDMPGNLFYVETSAKEDIKVKEMFDHVVHYVYHSSKHKPSTPSKSLGSNLMNSFYGNPLNNRRGSAVKTTEITYSPTNDLSHIQQQRQLHQQQMPVVQMSPPSMTEEQQIYDDNCTVNIVVAGACYSGKTAIVSQFMGDSNIFTPIEPRHHHHHSSKMDYQYDPTIGVDFRTYTDMVIDDMNLKLQIWDSSGNPAMRSVARAIYRDADGLILVYDISSEESFLALDGYLQDFLSVRDTPEDFVALLVGNKVDLSDKRAVPMERVLEWCAQKREIKPLSYVECSALTGTGIRDVFVLASDEVCDYLFEEDEYTETDYDDANELESESDEENNTNYTDVSVNEDDFTPVTLQRLGSRTYSNASNNNISNNISTQNTPDTNNISNISLLADASGDVSETQSKRRSRSKKRTSGRMMSGDLAALLNSELGANGKATAEAKADTSAGIAAVGDVPNSSASTSKETVTATDEKEAEEGKDSKDKKKKLKKTKSEDNDENILNQLVRTRTDSQVGQERTCWTDLWGTFNCVINAEPEPMAITEAENGKTTTK